MADTFTDLERLLEERARAGYYLNEFDRRIEATRAHHRRIDDASAIARGDWHLVFPDQSAIIEKPRVPNIVQLKLDDASALASTVQGSVRCDPANERSRPRAEKRERIAENYRKANNSQLMAPRFYQDLMLAGVNYRVVLPDFETGLPWIRRLDPRHCYLDSTYMPDRPVRDLICGYEESHQRLHRDYPLTMPPPRKGQTTSLVRVIEYYDGSEFLRVAELRDKGNKREGIILDRMPNLLSRIPVVVSARPTFDNQFRGGFDQVLGVLESNNRIFNLLLDATADMVSGQPVEYDIENAEDFGTGALLHSRSPQGYIRRMTPDQSSATLFQTLFQGMGNAREAAVYPEARSGDINQSIASAAFVSSIVGNLSTEMAHYQRLEAKAWGEALSLCLEVDEKYLDTNEPKYITGSKDGARFSESYIPSKDIKGDYGVRVEFGGAAGGDEFGHIIRLIQQHTNGLISRKTVMENLPDVKDVVNEEKQRIKEGILDAGLAFIQAQAANPQAPNFAPAAALIEVLEKDSETVYTVLSQFGDIQNPQQPQAAAGQAGQEAFLEAGNLQRGGLEPGANVGGVGTIPSLAELGIG